MWLDDSTLECRSRGGDGVLRVVFSFGLLKSKTTRVVLLVVLLFSLILWPYFCTILYPRGKGLRRRGRRGACTNTNQIIDFGPSDTRGEKNKNDPFYK